MKTGTQYYSIDCDSALGIYMHEANMEVHYGEGYAYCPILSWKMALVTSYNHQKELNLGAIESMRFVDQLNFHSQPLNHIINPWINTILEAQIFPIKLCGTIFG